MIKYQYGGYCPKCVQPVDTEFGRPWRGYSAGCCPQCGDLPPRRTVCGSPQWPQAPIRRVGYLWWARWEVKLDTPRSATAEELGIVPGIRPPPGAVQVPHRIESVESELRDMLTKDGV